MNKQILKNTVALIVSNVLVRIIGLVYKIWLAQAILPEALGYYQLSLSVYMLFISLPASGLPGAISKHYAAATDATKRSQIIYEGVRLGLSLSAIGGIILAVTAPLFAWLLLKNITCYSVLLALAPAIVLGGAASVPYGYLHASSKSTAVAVSEIIEQIVKVAAVFLLLYFFTVSSPSVQATVAAAGISVGGIISYIVIMKIIGRIKKNKSKEIKNELIKTAAPLTANRFITSFLAMITASLVPLRLIQNGLNTAEAFSVYGIINAMAMPIIMLPSTLISALCVTLLPRLASINASGKIETLKSRIKKVLIFAGILCGICSLVLSLTATFIGEALYSNTQAGLFIRYLSPCCIFVGINQLCSTVLTSIGHEFKTFKIHITTSVCMLVGSFIFTGLWGANGYAASIILQGATGTALFLYSTVNCVKKLLPKRENKCIVS